MKKSKQEMNVRLLLNRCELMAKEETIDGNWRLRKYVEYLEEIMLQLNSSSTEPNKETLQEYSKRLAFLKGLVETASLTDPIERVEAIEHLPHGATTACSDPNLIEIHQKTKAKYDAELKSELFGLDSDDTLRKRNIIKAPNFSSNSSGQEDMDTLLKYHQNMQEKVAENMILLTKNLKEQSQIASTIIKRDTEILKESTQLTDKNVDSLKVESEKLQEHSRGGWKCWLWIMIALVLVIFINMVLFMKVMKKKKL